MDSNVPVAPHNGKSDKASVEEAGSEVSLQSVLHPDRVAKNTSYLTLALVMQKILSLVYFVYISRSVGAENIGQYLTALAITTVFGIFIDLGFSPVLIREIAKHKDATSKFLNTTLFFKVILALFAYIAVFGYVHTFHYTELTRSLVAVTGLVMVVDSMTLTLYAVFRGHQLLRYEAIGTVVNKIIIVTIGVLGLRAGYGVHFLTLALLTGSVFNLLYAGTLLVRTMSWRPNFQFDVGTFKTLGRIAIPFAIASLFVTIYGYIDQVLLSHPLLVGDKGPGFLGWYGTAYKLTFALQFVPAAVAAAIFPAMSAYYNANAELLRKTFERAMFYLMVIVIPMTVGIVILAKDIILSAYGEFFSPSILPLRILVLSLPFVFLNYPVGYLLNATDRQSRNTFHIGIAMVVNILLNLALIPRYTFNGAAVASTVSSVLLFSLGYMVARQQIHINHFFLLKTLVRTVFASLVMAGAVILLESQIPLLVAIAIGAIVYGLTLILVKGFTLHDGMRIYNSFARRRQSS